eukprot:XP_001693790.1 predicted protein [Chlamydomonas reinhardtii]
MSQLARLPPELQDRIAEALPPNDVACTLRLLSRTLAAHFRSHTTVQLSQPVPHHAFVRRFGRWSAVRSLPLAQRRKLIALTAASGSLENLRVVAGGPDVTQAVGTAGCALTAEVFAAAAGAGHMHICKELYNMGCPWDTRCKWSCLGPVLVAAAAGGNPAVVEAVVKLYGSDGHHYSYDDYSRRMLLEYFGKDEMWGEAQWDEDDKDARELVLRKKEDASSSQQQPQTQQEQEQPQQKEQQEQEQQPQGPQQASAVTGPDSAAAVTASTAAATSAAAAGGVVVSAAAAAAAAAGAAGAAEAAGAAGAAPASVPGAPAGAPSGATAAEDAAAGAAATAAPAAPAAAAAGGGDDDDDGDDDGGGASIGFQSLHVLQLEWDLSQKEAAAVCVVAAYTLPFRPMARLVYRCGGMQARMQPALVAALAAALLSPTPDWTTKVLWIEGMVVEGAGAGAAAKVLLTWPRGLEGALCAGLTLGRRPPVVQDATWPLARLIWARNRGYRVSSLPPAWLLPLADAMHMQALATWLLEAPPPPRQGAAAAARRKRPDSPLTCAAVAAARLGHLETLEALARAQQEHRQAAGEAEAEVEAEAEAEGAAQGATQEAAQQGAAGVRPRPLQPPAWLRAVVKEATARGHEDIVLWAVQTYGAQAVLCQELWAAAAAAAAAAAGSAASRDSSSNDGSSSKPSCGLRLLDFLQRNGCPGQLQREGVCSAVAAAATAASAAVAIGAGAGGGGGGAVTGVAGLYDWLQRQGMASLVSMAAAAEAGDVELATRLVSVGAGHAALHGGLWKPAVEKGHAAFVEWLVADTQCPLPPPRTSSKGGGTRGLPHAEYRVALSNGDLGVLRALWQLEQVAGASTSSGAVAAAGGSAGAPGSAVAAAPGSASASADGSCRSWELDRLYDSLCESPCRSLPVMAFAVKLAGLGGAAHAQKRWQAWEAIVGVLERQRSDSAAEVLAPMLGLWAERLGYVAAEVDELDRSLNDLRQRFREEGFKLARPASDTLRQRLQDAVAALDAAASAADDLLGHMLDSVLAWAP